MVVTIMHDVPGWRPSWAQMLDIIERYCHEDETADELRWLRAHPTDWLIVARYMEKRTQGHIAKTRKALKEITIFDEAGHTTREYLRAKAAAEKLNAKRLHWIARLEEQTNEAKYILGYTKLPIDARSELVDRLARVRAAIISDMWDEDEVIRMLSALIHTYSGDENFDPNAYTQKETRFRDT